ncbi:preprotein translocase subunit YajC [Saccharopolyspora karakumensis]|uniref:Preprotein translocase subunit YajC n=1 Tax=Saccharopolyspora karakumensis TaxID=2530386 RepID=A0A4R5BEC5_9PSEU|nr:preprotein translocase subunit YajC [Saccharopolyspora karakumensis]TDD83669.1 preprotein translocase subunit YajC [Saccharopolyspora karakumensis]
MQLQSLILPLLIVLLAVPLFLQARKQKRAMAEQQKLQNSITAGDRVMTTSGVFGTVVSTSDDTIDIEIAPGMTTTWVRQAVREKVETEAAEAPAAEAPAEESATEETKVEDKSETEVADSAEKQKTS